MLGSGECSGCRIPSQSSLLPSNVDKRSGTTRSRPSEGVIIECPLNGQYHDRCDVILTSQMAVSNNFITVTVIQNIGTSAETVEKVIAMLEEDSINVLRFMASNGLIMNPNKKSFIILNSKSKTIL